ncbi:MAG: hypothetical protein WA399_16705 [Acidobacteriaceae bacterium]
MSATHFYRRYDPDGRCKVICMQCFQTLGTVWDRPSAEAMEAAHACEFWRQGAPAAAARAPEAKVPPVSPILQPLLQIPAGLLALLTVLVVYALPTALELAARHTLNAWLAVILPGDVVGCAVLAGLLRRPRTGVFLYLLLTTIEGLCYAGGVVPGRPLVWFADLVPTLVVLTLLLRRKLGAWELGGIY